MAKEQDLSLTPSTISGICGRLKCCLKYEHEGYLELEKTMPRRGELCECKEGRGRIVDRNLLTQKVTVQLDDSTHTVVCPASEVSVVYLDKYKIRAGNQGQGQGDDAARQKQSDESGEATKSDAGTAPASRPPRQQQGGGQDGQSPRSHGQPRKPGERPQRHAGEQRPQGQGNRPPQQQGQNRPQGQGSRPQGQNRPQGQGNRPQGQGRPPRPPRPSNEEHDADTGGSHPQPPPQN